MFLDTIIIFAVGLCVGSFLGVLIYREAVEDSTSSRIRGAGKKRKGLNKYLPTWVTGRSFCDHCHQPIRWYDNIPLLSYLLLRGCCRDCRKKIPMQYPILELMTGIQFVWVYMLIKGNLVFFARFEGFYSFVVLLFWLLVGAVFLMIFVSDLKYQIIPDSGLVLGVLLVLGRKYFDYLYTGHINWSFIAAGLGGALFFWAIYLLTKGKGMGFGDVKLAGWLGLLLGFPAILVAVFTAFLTGAFLAVILILAGQKKFGQRIAFGPFLIIGAITALIWGEQIIRWYTSLIF